MSVDTYRTGRTILTTQRRQFQDEAVGVRVTLGKLSAIRVFRTNPVYTELKQIFVQLWITPSNGNTYKSAMEIPFAAPQCMSMTREHWQNVMKELPYSPWFVSWKTNGNRFAMMITFLHYSSERVCVLVDRKDDFYLIEMSCPLSYYDGTMITGDLCDGNRLELDDIQAIGGNVVGNYDKKTRMLYAQQVVSDLNKMSKHNNNKNEKDNNRLCLCVKPWGPLENCNDFIQMTMLHYLYSNNDSSSINRFDEVKAKEFWKGTEVPDGLILQKVNAPLGAFTVNTILKMKPAKLRTRDYLPFVYPSEDRVDLYSFLGQSIPNSYNEIQRKKCKYFRNHWWFLAISQPLSATSQPLQHKCEAYDMLHIHSITSDVCIIHERVTEFIQDVDVNLWKPIKLRDQDKCYANHQKVLEQEDEDFAAGPVTLEEMLQSLRQHNLLLKNKQQQNSSLSPSDYYSHFSELIGIQTVMKPSLSRFIASTNLKTTKSKSTEKMDNENENDALVILSQIQQSRNAIKQLLPHHIHLNLSQPIFPTLTKYERSQVVGVEAERLALGGAALTEVGNSTSVIELAEKSLLNGTLPCLIKRPLTNGQVYEIPCHELDVQWNLSIMPRVKSSSSHSNYHSNSNNTVGVY